MGCSRIMVLHYGIVSSLYRMPNGPYSKWEASHIQYEASLHHDIRALTIVSNDRILCVLQTQR
jgi:hypothetical protein